MRGEWGAPRPADSMAGDYYWQRATAPTPPAMWWNPRRSTRRAVKAGLAALVAVSIARRIRR